MKSVLYQRIIGILYRVVPLVLCAFIQPACSDQGAAVPPFSAHKDINPQIADTDIWVQDANSTPRIVDSDPDARDELDSASEWTDAGGSPTRAGICDNPEDCPCEGTLDCALYDKMDLCAGVHLCIEGACALQPDTGVTCPLHAHTCKNYVCAPDFGLCLEEDRINGSFCDDEDPCTEDEICLALECKGAAILCDDQKPCTEDQCADGTCVFADTCEDGDPCTLDLCQADGSCSFAATSCDDENLCTYDHCALETGACVHDNITCDDGDACTADLCVPAQGCAFPSNNSCDVDFAKVNSEILEEKCVPCHAQGGPKRNFVGDADAMNSPPYISLCQNMGNNLPYTLAACISWLTTELGAMPPPWYQAETLLSDEWTQITYEQTYLLDPAEEDLILQWAEQGFPP